MKVLFAASEAVPFCKTGGLADVAGALPRALKRKGQDVRLILPKYREISADRFGLQPLGLKLTLPLGDGNEVATLWKGKLDRRIPVYFVDVPKYFDRDGLYQGPDGKDYPDNDERFALFSRAVLETAKAVDFRPDVIHAHDWQTGLIPAYLNTLYRSDAFFLPTASLFTIHNIAYQGIFPKNTLFMAGFSWADFTPDRLEFYDQVNFLKAGLVYADVVNTVSPAYAQEVLGPEFGRGMEGVLKARTKTFFGVLNGLDLQEWNPGMDAHLARRFTVKQIERRAVNKARLQEACGLDPDPKAPLLGMVSRLDPQKGVDLVLGAAPGFLADGCQLTVLGQGDKEYEATLTSLAKRHPGRVAYSAEFDEPLAHRIYGGADIFLMPSRFEPCGLGQMIALRYGAVPVVTPVGGLKDTVFPFDPENQQGVGFVARDLSPAAYREALAEALQAYRKQPESWKEMIRRGMACSFGWAKSVEKYLELYRLAGARKKEKD